jgi:hypothetical protein
MHSVCTTALLALCILLPASPASAQVAPLSNDNAAAILQKSLAATNLKAHSGQPFHLVATVKYKSDGPNLTGRFELFFSAPDRYRMNVTIGKVSETHIALGDKIYISRSSKNFSPEAWRIAEFLWYPGVVPEPPLRAPEAAAPTVKVEGDCEEETDAVHVVKACFDAGTQSMASLAIQNRPGARVSEDTVSLGDFRSLGANRYPGHLTRKSMWDTIDATVDSLTAESSFDANTFVPPANAIARDWCAAPEVRNSMALRHFAVVDYTLLVYYVQVGPDGHAKKFALLNDAIALPQNRQFLEGRPYPIRTCSGKPIEYDMVIITNLL